MIEERHISSLITHARSECVPEVVALIESMAGAEVFAKDHSGRIVVVVETANEADLMSLVGRIGAIQGVLATNLVFHQVEDACLLEEEQSDENHST